MVTPLKEPPKTVAPKSTEPGAKAPPTGAASNADQERQAALARAKLPLSFVTKAWIDRTRGLFDIEKEPPGNFTPEMFRALAYELMLDATPEALDKIKEVLSIDKSHLVYRTALEDAEGDVAKDAEHTKQLDTALQKIREGGEVKYHSRDVLAHYASLTTSGKRWYPNSPGASAFHQYITNGACDEHGAMELSRQRAEDRKSATAYAIGVQGAQIRRGACNNVEFFLRHGGAGIEAPAPLVAPAPGTTAPTADAAKDDGSEEVATKLEARVVAAIDHAKPKKSGEHVIDKALFKTLLKDIEDAKPKVKDLLYAKPGITQKLIALGDADQAKEIIARLDTVEGLYESLKDSIRPAGYTPGAPPQPPMPEEIYTKIRDYLLARPGKEGYPARARLLQHEQMMAYYVNRLDAGFKDRIFRLITNGTLVPTLADQIRDAAKEGNGTKAAQALMKLGSSSNGEMQSLKEDHLFRLEIEKVDDEYPVGTFMINPYHLCLTMWGLAPMSSKDPGSVEKQSEVNPDGTYEPLSIEKRITLEDSLLNPYATQLRSEIHEWEVDDDDMRDICRSYEAKAGSEPWVKYFRQMGKASGPALVEYYSKKYPDKNLRYEVSEYVSGSERIECERILGFRSESATLGTLNGKSTTLPEKDPKPPTKMELAQALKETIDPWNVCPLTQTIHTFATTICDSWMVPGNVMGFTVYPRGCSVSELLTHWKFFKNIVDMVKPQLTKLTELPAEKIHPIELLQNAVMEQGGDLTRKIQLHFGKTLFEDNDAPEILLAMGLTPTAVAARAKEAQAAEMKEDPEKGLGDQAKREYGPPAASLFGRIATMSPRAEQVHGIANDLATWLPKTIANAVTVAGPATASIEERPPKSFKGYYRLEYGVDPMLQVSRVLRSHRDNGANIDAAKRVFTDLRLELPGLDEAAIVAPKGDTLEITDANRSLVRAEFTVPTARSCAADLWRVLHDGGEIQLLYTKLYSDFTTEEQRLIRMAFRELSGGLDLQFYIQQKMAQKRGGIMDGVEEIGGKGTEKADAITKDTSLDMGSDMNQLAVALKVTRDGEIDGHEQFRSAVYKRDIDQLFRVTDELDEKARKKILADGPLMGAAREVCDAIAWDRVYKTITGQSDLTDRLYSRAHGKYGSMNPFDCTDEDGMKADIKAYVKRLRRQFDQEIRSAENLRIQGGGKAGNPEALDKAIEDKVKGACDKLMINPDVRKIIDEELSGDDLSQVEGLIFNAGESSTTADVARAGADAAQIVAGIRQTPPEKRAALRHDAAYLQKLASRLPDPKDMREAMDALMSDRPSDDKFGNLDKHATKGESRELLRDLADLDDNELRRLTKDVTLMSKILQSFSDDSERNLARQILTMKLPEVPPPLPDGSNQALRISESERRRVEFAKQNALARLRLPGTDGLGWETMLEQSIAVYNMEIEYRAQDAEGRFEQESDSELKSQRDERMHKGLMARHQIWDEVEAEVTSFARKAEKDKPKVTNSEVWEASKMVAVVRDAVLRRRDPSSERLKNNIGSKFMNKNFQTGQEFEDQHTNRMEGMKSSITNASAQHFIDDWSNILLVGADGKGPTLKKIYDEYRAAKAEAKKSNTEDSRALLDKKLAYMNFRIDISKTFEETILPNIGDVEDRTLTSDGGQTRLKERENKKYNELRDLARDRLASITKGPSKRVVGNAINVEDQEDLELLDNPNRDAIAGLGNRGSKYAFSRGQNAGSGWAATAERDVVDQSMAAYGHEVAQDQVNAEGGYGVITKREGAKIEEKGAEFDRSLQAFKDAKAKVAFWASMIVGVLVTAILTVLTGGLATGPLAALFFTTAIAGCSALAKAGVNKLVMGEDYEFKDEGVKMIGREMLTAFITCGTTMIAQKLVSTVSSAGTLARQARAAEAVMRQPPPLVHKFLAEAGEEVLSETMSGTIEAGLVAIDPEHWMHGVAEGRDRALPAAWARLSSVPGDALKAGITSIATSAVMSVGKKNELNAVAQDAKKAGGRVNIRENFKTVFGGNKERVLSAFVEWAVEKGFKGKIGNLEDVPADLLEGFISEVGEASQEMHVGTASAARRKKKAAEDVAKNKNLLNEQERKDYEDMAGNAGGSDPYITPLDYIRAREKMAIDALYSWADKTKSNVSTAQAKVYIAWVRQAIGPDEFQDRLNKDPTDVIKDLAKSGELQKMLDAQKQEQAKLDKAKKDLQQGNEQLNGQEQERQGTSIDTNTNNVQAGANTTAPQHGVPQIVTKVSSLDEGHAIMRMLAAGDSTILAKFNFKHEGGTDNVEWGLGRMPDGSLVIVRGEAGSVDFKKIPGMVALAHSHPAVLYGESRGLDVAAKAGGIAIDDLLTDKTNTHDLLRFLPSLGDLGFFADNNISNHVLFTPYVHLGNKQVGNPTDPKSIPPSQRIEIEIRNAHVAGRSSFIHHAPAYGATIIVRAGDGTVLWTGPMFQTRPYPNMNEIPSLTPQGIELGMMPTPRPQVQTQTTPAKVSAAVVDKNQKDDKTEKKPNDEKDKQEEKPRRKSDKSMTADQHKLVADKVSPQAGQYIGDTVDDSFLTDEQADIARWQTHGLEETATDPDISKMPDGSPKAAEKKKKALEAQKTVHEWLADPEFRHWYDVWMSMPDRIVVHKNEMDAGTYVVTLPAGMPAKYAKALDMIAASGNVALMTRALAISQLIEKELPGLDPDPNSTSWIENRPKLVELLGEAQVKKYENERSNKHQSEEVKLAEADRIAQVLRPQDLQLIQDMVPGAQIYMTGSAGQLGKKVEDVADLDLLVVMPKGTPAKVRAEVEARLQRIKVKRGSDGKELAIDAKVMTAEQFMGMSLMNTPGRTQLTNIRIDSEVDGELPGTGESGGDLHNHVMGVPGAQYFIDKVGGGNAVATLEKVAKDIEKANNAKPGEIRPNVIKVIMDGLRDVEAAKAAKMSPQAIEARARRALDAAMNASETVPFDHTYDIREVVVAENIDKNGKFENYSKDVITELHNQGVTFSEQSVSLKKLEGKFNEQTMDNAHKAAADEGKDSKLDFLVMSPNSQTLAQGDAPKSTEQVAAQTEMDQRLEKMLMRKDVKGMDVAGPEATKFTAAGMTWFTEKYAMLLRVAVAKGEKLVLRPHVGEGYDPQHTGEHVEVARHNLQMLIETLEGLGYNGSGDVIVRFGHATHATPDQMKRMAKIGIIVEANVGSNIATASVLDAKQHPLLGNMLHGVRTVLATDAQGVMGTTLSIEYQRAAALIAQFRAGEPLEIDGKQVLFKDLDEDTQKRFSIEWLKGELADYQERSEEKPGADQAYRKRQVQEIEVLQRRIQRTTGTEQEAAKAELAGLKSDPNFREAFKLASLFDTAAVNQNGESEEDVADLSNNIPAMLAQMDKAREGKDPKLQAKREKFERALALAILDEGPLRAEIDAELTKLCQKAEGYLRATRSGQALEVALAELQTAASVGYGGGLGLADTTKMDEGPEKQAAIAHGAAMSRKVLASGNMRERMMLFAAFQKMIGSDALTVTGKETLEGMAQNDGAGAFTADDAQRMVDRVDSFDADHPGKRDVKGLFDPHSGEKQDKHKQYADAKAQKDENGRGMDTKLPPLLQRKIDAFLKKTTSSAAPDQKSEKGENNQVARTQITVQQAIDNGLQLSDEEIAMAGGRNAPLGWVVGKTANIVNPKTQFIKDAKEKSMPLKAGISGTTYRWMQMVELLGGNPQLARLAAIASLQGADAHSFHEMAMAAQGFGVEYDVNNPYSNLGIPEGMVNDLATSVGTSIEELNGKKTKPTP